jgi:Tfp pilus assembly protein PilX
VDRGIVDVFAFQEALLIEAVFAVVILTMLWVGFRRWLQHKERMGRLIADQTAQIERVEERLKSIEQIVGDGDAKALPDPISTPDEV